jgi:putative addiction module component (TIGR02574 family)
MPIFDEVLEAVRSLKPSDRLRLVDVMWDDVSPLDWPQPSADWVAEARRRSEEFDRGEMKAAPWPEVRDRVRREAGLDD